MAIKLRPLGSRDLGHIMTWVNDPEVVKNFQNFDKKFSRQDEIKYVNKILKSRSDFAFSVFDGPDYIGQCGIHQISWQNKLGRISLIIKREHWNKGYAQRILPLLVKYAFKKLKLHKVWLMYWKENTKAGHLYSKLGFKKEGVLKDEYFWRGKYHDIIRMAMINSRG